MLTTTNYTPASWQLDWELHPWSYLNNLQTVWLIRLLYLEQGIYISLGKWGSCEFLQLQKLSGSLLYLLLEPFHNSEDALQDSWRGWGLGEEDCLPRFNTPQQRRFSVTYPRSWGSLRCSWVRKVAQSISRTLETITGNSNNILD